MPRESPFTGATCKTNTGSAQGYFLAGQSTTWILIGASTFATNIGAPMFVGLAGSAAASGISVVMFEWHAMFMLIALGWLFLPVYRASGCYTMPQYLKLRYGGNRIRLLLAVTHTLLIIISQIAGQMYAGALFIQRIFEWNLYLSVVLILTVTAVYTIIGGLTAVIWTDTIQTAILIIGSIVLGVFGLNKIGGWEAISQRYPEAMANYTYLTQALHGNLSCGMPRADAFHIFRSPEADYPWPGMIFGLTILATNAWCTDQLCVQRSLSAKNVCHAKAGVLLAAYLKVLPFLFFIIPGMISRIVYPDEVACADPEKCRAICSNPNGCTNIAYPLLVMRILPDGVRGIMLAALLSALMSSLTSMFNSSSTVFTMDIWRQIRRKAQERELMIVGRLYILFLVGISVAWLPILQAIQGSQLWNYTQSIYSFILPPIVCSFLLGLFWTRTTEKGAFFGICLGLAVGITRMGLSWSRPAPPCGSTEPDNQFDFVAKVHYLHFAMILSGISIFAMVAISLLDKPRSEAKLRRVTFWTRNDPQTQELSDESDASDNENEEKNEKDREEAVEKSGLKAFLMKWMCGMDTVAQKRMTKAEMRQLQLQSTSIAEDPFWSKVLDVNAVICAAAAIFLHAFWA